MCRRDEPHERRGRFIRVGALAVVAGFAGCARILFPDVAVAELLAGRAWIALSRATVARQGDVGWRVHLLPAATLYRSRDTVNGKGEQKSQNSYEPQRGHA